VRDAGEAIHYVAPVGEKDICPTGDGGIRPFLDEQTLAA